MIQNIHEFRDIPNDAAATLQSAHMVDTDTIIAICNYIKDLESLINDIQVDNV